MREDTTQELDRLNHYHAVSLEAIKEFAEKHPEQLIDFEKERAIALLNRMLNYRAVLEILIRNALAPFKGWSKMSGLR